MIELQEMKVHTADRQELLDFLTSNAFPYHVKTSMSRQEALDSVDGDRWDSDDTRTFWALEKGVKVGMVSLEDLSDPTPMFDLRLSTAERGRGLGASVLRAVTELVFNHYPEALRF